MSSTAEFSPSPTNSPAPAPTSSTAELTPSTSLSTICGLRSMVVSTRSRMAVTLSSLTLRRSEEHTSELQSRQYLVCRLLLEKKKKIYIHTENDAQQSNV